MIAGNTRRSELSLKDDCAVFLCLIFGSVRLEEQISTNEDEHLRFGFASITKSRNDLAGTHGGFLELEDVQAALTQR